MCSSCWSLLTSYCCTVYFQQSQETDSTVSLYMFWPAPQCWKVRKNPSVNINTIPQTRVCKKKERKAVVPSPFYVIPQSVSHFSEEIVCSRHVISVSGSQTVITQVFENARAKFQAQIRHYWLQREKEKKKGIKTEVMCCCK